MGIQFTALDTTRTRETVGGPRPMTVELPDQWDLFGFNVMNARMVIGLLDAATRFGDQDKAGPFVDPLTGEVSIPEARQAVMAARARFLRLAPELVREGEDFRTMVSVLGSEPSPQVAPGDLFRRLEDFSNFVEIAAAQGADLISWG